ncbi:MAG TPA: hypothetical protein PKN33_15205 [Phycisphaerae bacterium]|nr:hypothetical protein [Phycisphaerae bacterium]
METKTRMGFLGTLVMMAVMMILVVGTGCDFDDFYDYGYYDFGYGYDSWGYYDSGFDSWAGDRISTFASDFVIYD